MALWRCCLAAAALEVRPSLDLKGRGDRDNIIFAHTLRGQHSCQEQLAVHENGIHDCSRHGTAAVDMCA